MRRTLTATIVAALVVLALALPASARPAGPDSAATAAAAAASVPRCVVTSLDDSGYTDYLTVFNGCSYAVRVKVVLAFHTDKPAPRSGRTQFAATRGTIRAGSTAWSAARCADREGC